MGLEVRVGAWPWGGSVLGETDEEPAELKKHLHTPRHVVAYVMDAFPIVRRKDEQKHGDYRTKRVILDIYGEMQRAIETHVPYQTRLDPPPADPRVAHKASESGPGSDSE